MHPECSRWWVVAVVSINAASLTPHPSDLLVHSAPATLAWALLQKHMKRVPTWSSHQPLHLPGTPVPSPLHLRLLLLITPVTARMGPPWRRHPRAPPQDLCQSHSIALPGLRSPWPSVFARPLHDCPHSQVSSGSKTTHLPFSLALLQYLAHNTRLINTCWTDKIKRLNGGNVHRQ